MTEKIVQFHPETIGEAFRFDPDEILEAAKGQEFTTVAVLGQLPDGTIWISGNANAGETLVLMERSKRVVVFGEE
ncbi:phosphoribosylformylglycinamidine synthase [Nitratireductor sp. ac15]